MKEKTTVADKYLLEHFYGTCTAEGKNERKCRGIELEENYSWIDVILAGEKNCGECSHCAEGQGFYYGKNKFSEGFEKQEFVTLNNIRTQEEFKSVCRHISKDAKGIVIRGAVTDASPFEAFSELEFVALETQRLSHFWDTGKNTRLRMLTVWMNRNLKSLSGLERAVNLESLQLYTSFSDATVHKIESLEPISGLKKLREVILSATEPTDHNIDYLIHLPRLEYLWISPNLFPMECYAKFEAKRFMLSDEYGIYCEESDDIYPYGKGKRVMHTPEQKQRYLDEYNNLMQKYKEV